MISGEAQSTRQSIASCGEAWQARSIHDESGQLLSKVLNLLTMPQPLLLAKGEPAFQASTTLHWTHQLQTAVAPLAGWPTLLFSELSNNFTRDLTRVLGAVTFRTTTNENCFRHRHLVRVISAQLKRKRFELRDGTATLDGSFGRFRLFQGLEWPRPPSWRRSQLRTGQTRQNGVRRISIEEQSQSNFIKFSSHSFVCRMLSKERCVAPVVSNPRAEPVSGLHDSDLLARTHESDWPVRQAAQLRSEVGTFLFSPNPGHSTFPEVAESSLRRP